jgi:hypothetical protein
MGIRRSGALLALVSAAFVIAPGWSALAQFNPSGFGGMGQATGQGKSNASDRMGGGGGKGSAGATDRMGGGGGKGTARTTTVKSSKSNTSDRMGGGGGGKGAVKLNPQPEPPGKSKSR